VAGRAGIELSGVQVDPQRGTFEGPTGAGRLSGRERELLAYLVHASPRVVPRAELLAEIWGRSDPRSRAVDATWSRLRRKLEVDPTSPRHLLTIHGDGYRLDLGTSERTSTVAAPLARPEPDLFGREQALRDVSTWLAAEQPWLTLWGPGGVGKTRLLHAVLSRCRAAGSSAVLVPLESVTDVDEALLELASALGISLQAQPSTRAQIVRACRDRAQVWGLDNLEQLGAQARELLELAVACGSVRVVATSRAPVRHIRETLLPLEGLDPSASRALVAERLGDHASLDDAALSDLIQRTQGLPLALELAAGHAARTSLRQAVADLYDVRDEARTARHQTLVDVVEHSVSGLSERCRHALAALSVLHEPIELGAAERVAGLDGAVLGELVSASLVQQLGADLHLHPAVRAWATRALRSLDPTHRTRARYRRWILARVAALATDLRGPEPGPAMTAARRLGPGLRTVLLTTRPGHHHDLAPVLPFLRRFVPAQTDALRWLDLLDRVSRRARAASELHMADRIDVEATVSGMRVLGPDARRERLARVDRSRLNSDDRAVYDIMALDLQAVGGEPKRAEAHLRTLLEQAHALPREAADLARLRVADLVKVDPDNDALQLIQRARDSARQHSDALAEAHASRELGGQLMHNNRYDQALPHLDRALVTFRQIDDAMGVAKVLQVRASIAFFQGELDQAIAFAREGLRAAPAGSPMEAILRSRLGLCLRRQGELDAALEHTRRAAESLRLLEEPVQAAIAWAALASVHLARQELDQADAAYRVQLEQARLTGRQDMILGARSHLQEVLMRRGQDAEALDLIEDILSSPHLTAYERPHVRSGRAEVRIRLGARQGGLSDLRAVYAWARERRHSVLLQHSCLNLAQLRALDGDRDGAAEALAACRGIHELNAYQVRWVLQQLDQADLHDLIGERAPDPADVLDRALS